MGTVFQQYLAKMPALRRDPPPLMGLVGACDTIDAFVKRFGTCWRKTPVANCWYLASDGMQFTIVPYGDKWDIAYYDYETVAEFRSAFESKTHVGNAVYFQTMDGDHYTIHAVIRFLESQGVAV